MQKFAVRLNGEGFRAEIAGHSDKRRPATGFFTTRFVEAVSEDDAVSRAIRLVEEELATRPECRRLPGSTITPVEVREDPADFDQYAPGRGFTWS